MQGCPCMVAQSNGRRAVKAFVSTNQKSKPKAEAANTPVTAFLQNCCAKGCARPWKPSPAARRRPDAPPQRICCKSYAISVLQRATTTRSAKLQRRELCVAIVLEAGLCCEKLGRGGIAIFAGLSGFDPLRVDACAPILVSVSGPQTDIHMSHPSPLTT